MGKYRNIIGEKFGRLTVTSSCEVRGKKRRYWLCKCDCGKEKWIYAASLFSGGSQSCGCLLKDNKKQIAAENKSIKKTRIYRTYLGIISRCYNHKNIKYKIYGGNGVSVYPEWRENFQSFYDYAYSIGYRDDLQCGRNGDIGNYEPDNIKFIPIEENASKKLDYNKVFVIRKSHKIGAFTKEELCAIYGIGKHCIDSILTYKTWKQSLSCL